MSTIPMHKLYTIRITETFVTDARVIAASVAEAEYIARQLYMDGVIFLEEPESTVITAISEDPEKVFVRGDMGDDA